MDLFATSINTKCPCFVSWHPDRFAYAVDAFSLFWNDLHFYAFPPFILILRVLCKIITDQAEEVVIIPWWPAQLWFPLFNQLIVEQPIQFNPDINMLTSSFRDFYSAWSRIFLVAARLSGKPSYLRKPLSALAATLASLSKTTLAQYLRPIKL